MALSSITPITQPEQVLEDALVAQLAGKGYARAAVTDEASMLANLKAQQEAFNGVMLTAGEFTQVVHHLNKSPGVYIIEHHAVKTRNKEFTAMFGTNFSTKDRQSFYSYYQDIARKVKERKVDLLLVVNMFLTGFDSKSLNTFYVDKNLRFHGLGVGACGLRVEHQRPEPSKPRRRG